VAVDKLNSWSRGVRGVRSILNLAVLISLLSALGCGHGHAHQIEGDWTTHDSGYRDAAVSFNSDGTFTLKVTTFMDKQNIEESRALYVTENGKYSGGDDRLDLQVQDVNISSDVTALNAMIARHWQGVTSAAFFVPLAGGGPLKWVSDEEFEITYGKTGESMNLVRVTR